MMIHIDPTWFLAGFFLGSVCGWILLVFFDKRIFAMLDRIEHSLPWNRQPPPH